MIETGQQSNSGSGSSKESVVGETGIRAGVYPQNSREEWSQPGIVVP